MSKLQTSTDSSSTSEGQDTQQHPSRTIAILAKSACKTHRVAIQARITSAGFDILDERLEQWSKSDDLDFLEAFLGRNEKHRRTWIERLSDAPIYVMVLERHCAAERWVKMCGPDLSNDGDQSETYDEDGMVVVPSGLRAQYGAGALYASPPDLAPRQIAICFPELATSEAMAALRADEEEEQRASLAAVGMDGGFLVRQDDDIVYDEQGKAFDAHSGEPLELGQEIILHRESSFTEATPGQSEIPKNGPGSGHNGNTEKTVFRARPLPKSIHRAPVQPRLSRAAALRMGVQLKDPPKRSESQNSSSHTQDTVNVGISGLRKTPIAQPKSLAAPIAAPRMNKAAAARVKGAASLETESQPASRERKLVDYSNTPGHKRASLGATQLASLMAPSVAPRTNRAAASRAAAHKGFNEDTASETGSRGSSHQMHATHLARARVSSGKALPSGQNLSERKAVDFSNTPGHKRVSTGAPSALKSLQAPAIAPRGNRASMSRAGIASAEEKQAAASRISSTHLAKPSRPGLFDGPKPRPTNKENVSGIGKVSSAEKEGRERRPVDFSDTPGHKRVGQGTTVASLARPTIEPRSNVAAKKRLSVGGVIGRQADEGCDYRRPTSVLGQMGTIPGNAGRPSSRISVGSMPHSAGATKHTQQQKRSSRPIAPPSSFRL